MTHVSWRREVRQGDVEAVQALCAATGFFTPEEVRIAGELVADRLNEGAASDYHFVLADVEGKLVGYACFGLIAGTDASFDLYWIVVDPSRQGARLGRQVLTHAEQSMRDLGATRYYAETSSTERYAPTRAFYHRTGFREVANIADFYRPGDGKVIYERLLGLRESTS